MFLEKLYHLGAIQFGTYTLKSGTLSPFYIDLRKILSHPELLSFIADVLYEKIQGLSFDRICGVPYTALPFATALSLRYDLPMILKRKEKKEHGTKQMIEGSFSKGQTCLIIEDLITSGSSVLETKKELEAEGLIVKDAVVLIDRAQGGKKRLQREDCQVHPIFTLQTITQFFVDKKLIDPEQKLRMDLFIRENQFT